MLAEPGRHHNIAGTILTFGFATAVAMWCLAALTHLPGATLAGVLAGPVLLAVLAVGTLLAAMTAPRASAWRIGLGTGLVAGLLNLLILGSVLTQTPTTSAPGTKAPLVSPSDSEQPVPFQGSGDPPAPDGSSLRPGALTTALGFLALACGIGLAAGALGGVITRRPLPRDRVDWPGRFGFVTAAAFAPLLLSGGLVTSTGAGLSVPDWPTSYGANMFLLPIGIMADPRIFLEHTHRLFGSLVGLTTLTLMIWTLVGRRTLRERIGAVLLFVLVALQGLAGGARVVETSTFLAIVHGISAQLIFALAMCQAAWMSTAYRAQTPFEPDRRDRRRKTLATGMLHATIVQLALGATYRHLKAGGSPGATHALLAHAGLALVVVILAVLAGGLLSARHGNDTPIAPIMRRLGHWIIAAVAIQFVLGWTALGALMLLGTPGTPPPADQLAHAPPIPPVQALIGTAHQANGALVLALAALGLAWSRRLVRLGRQQPTA